jgi:hypothetical protein
MIANTIEINGTLHADGQLILDEKPNLRPGRVHIAMQTIEEKTESDLDLISLLKRIHAEKAERGDTVRTREEIDAVVNAMRDDDLN